MIDHPRKMIRDTSTYIKHRKLTKGKPPSLKRLAKEYLGIDFQGASHSSVEDSRVAMQLYKNARKEWERYISSKNNKVRFIQSNKKKRSSRIRRQKLNRKKEKRKKHTRSKV